MNAVAPMHTFLHENVKGLMEGFRYDAHSMGMFVSVAAALSTFEKIALEDDYFVSRKLYPNVDFYSGLIYQALGLPTGLFPVMFAIPRTAGWLAQWLEGVQDPEQKIARPLQLYTGHAERDFFPIDSRRAVQLAT